MIENRKGFIQPAKPEKIKMSPELEKVQSLMPIDPTDRANLKSDIEAHGIREPLKVYESGGAYYLLAGKNRLDIALELGLSMVNVELLRDLPESEREQFCIDDNLNRRHLTREQKRGLIDRELKQNPAQSDNLIAKKTKASDKTVTARREVLEARSEIPKVKEKAGADGKTYRKPEKKAPQTAQNRSGGAQKGKRDIQDPLIISLLKNAKSAMTNAEGSSKTLKLSDPLTDKEKDRLSDLLTDVELSVKNIRRRIGL